MAKTVWMIKIRITKTFKLSINMNIIYTVILYYTLNPQSNPIQNGVQVQVGSWVPSFVFVMDMINIKIVSF